jgi:hypothetical protein
MPLHFAEHLADAPERLCLFQAVGNGGVADQALLRAAHQHIFQRAAQRLAPRR